MTSLVAWLDASAEEQRRVREIVQMFSQRETQDELGGRRIVVTIADALFPGTSVLHSRARYLVFIPWLAKTAASKKDPAGSFTWQERQMIQAFLDADSVPILDRLEGLIGREAGPKVKQLPSSAYWTALEAWGVLLMPGSIPDTLKRTRDFADTAAPDGADELAARQLSVWQQGVGEAPTGFPTETLDGGFRLKQHEAAWLRERWLDRAGGSLLAHLARTSGELSDQWAPWREPQCRNADAAVISVLDEAERFSLAMAGARLLYHLMVSERYAKEGFDRVATDEDAIRSDLDEWAAEVADRAALFAEWHPSEFWNLVRNHNPRVNLATCRFFDTWFDRIRRGDVDGIADDKTLRGVVAAREQFLKRSHARLVNNKLLAGWQGGYPGRVNFRWAQVRRLVTDVRDGMQADART